MRKVIAIIICICLLVFSYELSRKFIRIGGDNWVTVWKRYGNRCLIIPGRYYGLTKPSEAYLETENTAVMNIFVLPELPNRIVFRTKSRVNFVNKSTGDSFLDYHSDEMRLNPLIYTQEKPLKVRDDVKFVFVDIHDSMAMSSAGERLW